MNISSTKRHIVAGMLLALLACGPPDFVFHVTFPGRVDIEKGARVVYKGLVVGRVAAISLRQESPEAPALVELTLAIWDPEVMIREADRFHVTSEGLLGDSIVQIDPSEELSKPLESGVTVAGVPPLATRIEQSVSSAIEAFREAISEKSREVLDQIKDSIEEQEEEQSAPPPSPSGG